MAMVFRRRFVADEADSYPLYGINVWETPAAYVDYTIANMKAQASPATSAGCGSLFEVKTRSNGNRVRVIVVYHWKIPPYEIEESSAEFELTGPSWFPLMWFNFLRNLEAYNWTTVREPPNVDDYFDQLETRFGH